MGKKLVLLVLLVLISNTAFIEAAEQKVVMDIEGMTCKLCPLAIKKSLAEIDGIKKVKVSYKDKKAILVIDETVTDEILVEAVEKAGSYTVNSIEREVINTE